ncbi:MAG: rRNA maturation RNase YbeY [Candidatus Magasanikbacteria bacterium]|jgi:probable rRNA maturation factor
MIKINYNSNIKNKYSAKDLQKIALKTARKEKKIMGMVEVNMVGDKEMTKLNFNYRGKKCPTDVLSFAWEEDKTIRSKILGQIYICYPQIKRQAREWKIKEQEELSRMLIHGLLHLVGHDHIKKEQAKKMFKIQEEVINELGYVSQKFI